MSRPTAHPTPGPLVLLGLARPRPSVRQKLQRSMGREGRRRRHGSRGSVAVGDWVALEGQAPVVTAVLPRRTELVRQSADGTSEEQVLAANVDVGVIVEPALRGPRPGRVERLAALVWRSGARPVVVLTRADLVPDAAAMAWALEGECRVGRVYPVDAPGGVGLGELGDGRGARGRC